MVYLVILYAGMKIWGYMGGWPVAYWRIRRFPAFIQYIVEPDGRISINPHKMTIVKTDTLAHFEYRGGEWFWGDADNIGLRYGLPTIMHQFDDSRPIPIRKGEKPRMPPMEIHKSYANKSIGDANRIGVKQKRGSLLLLVLLVMAVLVLSEVAIYYYNAACAAHSPVCIPLG